MSEQVKRYWMESFIDDFYRARQFVLASDYDTLAQRCRELDGQVDNFNAERFRVGKENTALRAEQAAQPDTVKVVDIARKLVALHHQEYRLQHEINQLIEDLELALRDKGHA